MSPLRNFWTNWTDLLAMQFVKTAISIPNDLFAQADALAGRLQISRSELYAIAVAAVYSDLPSGVDPALRRAQANSLAGAW